MKWKILGRKNKELVKELLKNRGLTSKKDVDDFFNPKLPELIDIPENIISRLEIAKINKEKIVIFGDYDCDGVCATAILWEAMYKSGFQVMPYIPDRFSEGYGIKKNSIDKLDNPKLIITVDNGIVAYDAVTEAKKLGIDTIIIDHHAKGNKKLNTKYILHSTEICGSALAWMLSCKVRPCKTAVSDLNSSCSGLDLVALATIADQIPLIGINRSLVKYGLEALNNTKRIGLNNLFRELKLENVGVYEIGYIIAPRINAMGRLASAIDSLRFLCTRDQKKASNLNKLLNEMNIKRQNIVDDVLIKTLEKVSTDKIIVISGDYHEGVIGLASGKVTEKFYRPSIVLSINGTTAKASARSIYGFNIIEAIKETELILEGGGHPMAAGFSIETSRIEEFRLKINELSKDKLTDEILERKLIIDMEINFTEINTQLVEILKKFEPTGQGNYSPVFTTRGVSVMESKPVGQEGKHFKLKLEQNGIKFDAIWFNAQFTPKEKVDIAYSIEENIWNNKTSIQLKIKDIK